MVSSIKQLIEQPELTDIDNLEERSITIGVRLVKI